MFKIIKSLALVSVAVAAVVGGTYAYFSDSASTATVEVDSATLSLDGTGFNSFNLGDIAKHMAPGDKTSDVKIIIKNDGTTDLAWFGDLVVTGGNKLREAVYIDYAKMEFKDDANGTWETTDVFINDGVYKYNNNYKTYFDKVSLKAWDGNNDMGSAPYEHMGALKPGYSYELTLRFGFAEGAGNAYQSDVTDPINVSFKVNATQILPGALNELKAGFGTNHPTWLNAQIEKQEEHEQTL